MTDQTLVQALVKAQSEMATPIKDKVNPQFKSKYASLGSIIDAVKGALNSNGIVFVQKSTPVDDGIAVETIFYGYGEEIATGPVHVPVDKVTAQGYGSAMTYAKRYSLAMACGVDADEDDDGNAASESAFGSKQAKTKTRNAMLKAANDNDKEALEDATQGLDNDQKEIGRASCRERV